MKKIIVSIIVILVAFSANAQDMLEIDSVSYVMCDYLKTLTVEDDTLKINMLFEKKLYPYLGLLQKSKAQKAGEQIYYRLQRNCEEFRYLLNRLNPSKEATLQITEKPISEISKKQLKKFKDQKQFYYFEVSGDTTKVLMENGYWIDSFPHNTFSRMSYHWINDTEFKLVYLESNNEIRSNISMKGDTYIYQVLSKKNGFYLMSITIPGQETFQKFKIYYNKKRYVS